MTHLGLFEGVGGFSLAARMVGWHTVATCEIDPWNQTVLRYHFPEAEHYGDIYQTDFSIYANRVDVLTGGFPCQPYSISGKRKGTEDNRHLWPEMLRVIGQVRPRWIVGENVRGLIDWSDGLVFQQVCTDLETEGYAVQPFLLPASGVNAPHERYRVWIVAYAHQVDTPSEVHPGNRLQTPDRGKAAGHASRQSGYATPVFDRGQRNISGLGSLSFDQFPTEPVILGRNDGIPEGLDPGTVSKWERKTIEAMGNAIVPAVAVEIFHAINQYEQQF